MNRRSIFTFSAIAALALALSPSSSVAQQGSLRQQLVGTWTLVSCDPPANAICVNSSGSYNLDANGRYTMVIAAQGRPKSTTTAATTFSRANTTPDYYKAIAQGIAAQFGTWSVNETDKTLTQHVEGALFPNGEGADRRYSVSLTGDELKLVGGAIAGEAFTWRRAK